MSQNSSNDDEKFKIWLENLKRTYGSNSFLSKEWLEKEWNQFNSVQSQISDLNNETQLGDSGMKKKEKLTEIQSDLGDCKRCKLCKTRTNIVFGEGNSKAKLLFVGEGPGEKEDLSGRPFVGRAGQLLDKIIEAMEMKREDVFIANVVKCRPPENRRPDNEEVAKCEPFLMRQIESINPKVIVALGATALECLLKTDEKITNVRGKFLDFHGRKLLPTYHPAYLLRNPPAKKDVWDDMKKVMAELK